MTDVFQGFDGGGDWEMVNQPGWYRVKIKDLKTRRRNGDKYVNNNGNEFWLMIMEVEGGIFNSFTIMDRIYLKYGWRLRPYCKAVDYEPPMADDGKGRAPDAETFAGNTVVVHLKQADITDRKGNPIFQIDAPEKVQVDPVLSVESAKDLIESGEIQVDNIDGSVANEDIPF